MLSERMWSTTNFVQIMSILLLVQLLDLVCDMIEGFGWSTIFVHSNQHQNFDNVV